MDNRRLILSVLFCACQPIGPSVSDDTSVTPTGDWTVPEENETGWSTGSEQGSSSEAETSQTSAGSGGGSGATTGEFPNPSDPSTLGEGTSGEGTSEEGEESSSSGSTGEEDPAVCGDGQVGAGEECDHGGVHAQDCNQDCTLSICGDGKKNYEFEECDDGNDDNTDLCVNGCFWAKCGDGFTWHVEPPTLGGEECDDNNQVSGDGCSFDCKVELDPCGQPPVVGAVYVQWDWSQAATVEDAVFTSNLGSSSAWKANSNYEGAIFHKGQIKSMGLGGNVVSLSVWGDWDDSDLYWGTMPLLSYSHATLCVTASRTGEEPGILRFKSGAPKFDLEVLPSPEWDEVFPILLDLGTVIPPHSEDLWAYFQNPVDEPVDTQVRYQKARITFHDAVPAP